MSHANTTSLNPYDIIALIIHAADGKLNGRTALQKLAYLSSVKISEIEDLDFKAHYYGPYSAKLSMSLANMVSYSFLEENNVPGNRYNGYLYKLTDDGSKITDDIMKNHAENYKTIKKIVKTCSEFCNLESKPLSYASKIHYLLFNTLKTKQIPEDEIKKCAEDLGWDITDTNVRQGMELLKKLELDRYTK